MVVKAVKYVIEIYDTWGRRIASYDEVPLMEAVRRTADSNDRVHGILPAGVADLSPGYRVRAIVDGETFCDVPVTEVAPQWSDARKLILDRYVRFQEVVELLAEGEARRGNVPVTRAFTGESVSAMVRAVINHAVHPIHYTVQHGAYPEGAEREYLKFLARKSPETELEVGGIAEGQWVGGVRIDVSGAYAKDGDTIAGLEVDGAPWPDVRLMLIDCEETSRNSHAVSRHAEVAQWTNEQYTASGYKLKADAAKSALQWLIDSRGIDYIELNPHRDVSGAFDDRVDAFGRYLGLVYGSGQCLNAAMVELGHADVFLYQDGRYLVPEMELKDFFSYTGPHIDSIEEAASGLIVYDAAGGLLEVLSFLAYAAGGYVWSVDHDLSVRFTKADRPDHVWFFDPVAMGVQLGSKVDELANLIYFDGNPITGTVSKTYVRGESVDEYGATARSLKLFGISREEDADTFARGVLDDVAYPEPTGEVTFFRGKAGVRVGELVEVRGAPLRRLERELAGEWAGRFAGRLVGRVSEVRHRFSGARVSTRIRLTSPLRSVRDPLRFIVRSQPDESEVFQFRLDDAGAGLDGVHHLD
ncbi:MAG: hypothetical protein AMXMBFR4_07550 [Candidatus Hydrogenedentota bacterium]